MDFNITLYYSGLACGTAASIIILSFLGYSLPGITLLIPVALVLLAKVFSSKSAGSVGYNTQSLIFGVLNGLVAIILVKILLG